MLLSPSYFHVNADGSLELSDSLQASFIADMHQRGKRVVPFLSNDFDRSLGEKAIDNREALVNQIVEAIKDNNLDGIQLDIENVDAAYRDKYTDLVKMLRDKLPQRRWKFLSQWPRIQQVQRRAGSACMIIRH